jgi:Domain of unknown function (DUF4377)
MPMTKWLLFFPLALSFGACRLLSSIESTIEVAPETKKCVWSFGGPREPDPIYPVGPILDCIQARTDSSQNFRIRFDIQGFTFEPGYKYRLRIRSYPPQPNVADDFGYDELIAILEKTPVTK